MKYLRSKADGAVYNFHYVLADRTDMEAFECDVAPPQNIPDLLSFLRAQEASRVLDAMPDAALQVEHVPVTPRPPGRPRKNLQAE